MCQFDRSSLAGELPGCGRFDRDRDPAVNPKLAGPFVQGTIIGLTGANAGQTVARSPGLSGGTVTVKLAFLSPPAAGDQFQLLPGCDRTLATCTNVFNNAVHFGGFPYIPTPETAV